jgi:hypothetical protein
MHQDVSEPLPDPAEPVEIHPLEERDDVVDAAEDDVTVSELTTPDSGPDDLTPQFREPT